MLESIPCPCCGANKSAPWATECGFTVTRCAACRFLYVNPRPSQDLIDRAVKLGVHADEAGGAVVKARRVARKVPQFRRILARMFDWSRPVHWIDIGAGYGEIVEAVSGLAPRGSKVEGVEPMQPKVAEAQRRGLAVREGYFEPDRDRADVLSLVDVFSHLPDVRGFLAGMAGALKPGGELFLTTGNLADLERREQFPSELGLPDHLVFAGEQHIARLLGEAGFEIVAVERERYDTPVALAKDALKLLMGRPAKLRLPYTSPYRGLFVRARRLSR